MSNRTQVYRKSDRKDEEEIGKKVAKEATTGIAKQKAAKKEAMKWLD